jgi:glycerol-3-phosphate acyltransferase PlsY
MSGTLSWVLAAGVALLLGSLPVGYWWGRLFAGIDVRERGSRNTGATNVGRVLGVRHGIAVFLLDALKGSAAVLAGRVGTGREETALLCGLLAVIGHVASPWLGFKGGKGVATGVGAWGLLAPGPTAAAFALWGLVLALSRRMSAASLAAASMLPVLTWLDPHPAGHHLRVAAAAATALLVWIRHRANFRRLVAGTEPPLWGARS